MWKTKLTQLKTTCFDGDITLPKVNFWLVALTCLLAGIVFGLLKAPWTHGVMIGSNNGNYNNYGLEKSDKKTDDNQDSQEKESNDIK